MTDTPTTPTDVRAEQEGMAQLLHIAAQLRAGTVPAGLTYLADSPDKRRRSAARAIGCVDSPAGLVPRPAGRLDRA